MPKREEKKVLVNGICTCPPLLRAANSRSASASFGTVSDSEKPWKLDLGAELATVELDRLFAAAVEEQIGLDLHLRLLA